MYIKEEIIKIILKESWKLKFDNTKRDRYDHMLQQQMFQPGDNVTFSQGIIGSPNSLFTMHQQVDFFNGVLLKRNESQNKYSRPRRDINKAQNQY